MAVQGGPMSVVEAEAFSRLPYAEDAVRLRQWDDIGKDPDRADLTLNHFRQDIDAVDLTLRRSSDTRGAGTTHVRRSRGT
jgi:predicted HD phosphohydrolase